MSTISNCNLLNKINSLILATLLIALSACKKPSADGTYIVLSSQKLVYYVQGSRDENYNEEQSMAIAQQIKGKKYSLTFNDKYVTLKSSDGQQEVLINRNNEVAKQYPSDTTYQTGASLGGKFHDILITAHTTRKEPSVDMRLIVYENPIDSVGRFAFIRCELLKVKDK